LYTIGKTESVALSETPSEPYVRNVLFYGDLNEYLYKDRKIEGKLSIYEVDDTVSLMTVNTDRNGRFSMLLPADKYYKVLVEAEGYVNQSVFVNSLSNTDKEYVSIIVLRKGDGFIKGNLEESPVARKLIEYSSLQINLTDQITGNLVNGTVSIKNVNDTAEYALTKQVVGGKLVLPVVGDCVYSMSVTADNYCVRANELVNIPADQDSYEVNVQLLPLTATAQRAGSLSFKNILFNSAKFDVTNEFANDLMRFAKQVASDKNVVITLTGHADSTGPDAMNMRLSENRARSVAKFLKKYGVLDSQIVIVAKGETEPIASNETEEGKRLNRRVEFSINYK